MKETWVIWLALFVGTLVLEAITLQFFSIWFSVGALAAVIAYLFHAPGWAQILVFVAVTTISLIATRPLVRRLQKKKPEATNADRFVGQTAVVLEEIDNIKGTGLIKVMGQTWSARAAGEGMIPEGAQVHTLSIQGAKLLVEPAAQQNEESGN